MTIERRARRREPTLRPSRWPPLPRRATFLRATLVAGLLALAAGILYTQEPRQSCPAAIPATGGSDPEVSPSTSSSATRVSPTNSDPGLELDPTSAPDRLAVPTGTVGVPVRLAEPAALAVVRPGARVDLLAVPDGTGSAARSSEPTLLAARALVLGVIGSASAADGTSALYLALPPDQANRVVGMPEGVRFSIIVRP
ncbi:flagellar biosynthesis protein FlgA [Micromonospora sp. NPDC003197]